MTIPTYFIALWGAFLTVGGETSLAQFPANQGDSLRQSGVSGSALVREIEFEFGNLIVDETQTKIGHDFYDLFYNLWEAPEGISGFTIIVGERTLPRLGTQVTIRLNDNDVYQNFIQPRFDAIEEAAGTAVAIVLDYLLNFEQIQRELQGSDMQGSGIF